MMNYKITLRAARVNLGLTLKDAAKEFKMSHITLGHYEKDSTNVPHSFFSKVESVYGIPAENVFFGKQEDYFHNKKKEMILKHA
jgi:transcriptional regulator with XRE-family HTH domain